MLIKNAIKNVNACVKDMNTINVDDILTYAYSYNARIPQFVQVTRKTNKTIWFKHIKKTWVCDDGYGQNGTVAGIRDAFTSNNEQSVRIKTSNDRQYCVIDRCYATIWDGTPQVEYTD